MNTLKRTSIEVLTNLHVILRSDIGGSEMSYLDLAPRQIMVENSVNGDGSVRVALVFDCDLTILDPDETAIDFVGEV